MSAPNERFNFVELALIKSLAVGWQSSCRIVSSCNQASFLAMTRNGTSLRGTKQSRKINLLQIDYFPFLRRRQLPKSLSVDAYKAADGWKEQASKIVAN